MQGGMGTAACPATYAVFIALRHERSRACRPIRPVSAGLAQRQGFRDNCPISLGAAGEATIEA
jgi:hypothetical protein